MSTTSFESYMEQIDRSASKRVNLKPEDILIIFNMAADKEANRNELTDQRLGLIFYIIDKQFKEYSADQLVQLMVEIGKLKIDPNKYYKHFFAIWEKQIYAKMTTDISNLIDILDIYVHFKEDLPEEIVQSWSRVACEVINQFSNEKLCHIMHVFTMQKIKPEASFIKAWSNRMAPSLDNLDGENLANVVYSCGKLNIDEMNAAIQDLRREKFMQMNGHQMCKALYGLVDSKIKYENDEQFKNDCVEILKRSINAFNLHDLARLIWLISKDDELSKDDLLWTSWEKSTEGKLSQKASAQDLNMILTSLVRLARLRKCNFVKLLTTKCSEEIEEIWPEMLPNMLADLCMMGHPPTDEFVKRWLKRLKEIMSRIFARDFVTIILSLADNRYMVGQYDQQFVNVWKEEAKEKSASWSDNSKLALRNAFQIMNVEIDYELEILLQ